MATTNDEVKVTLHWLNGSRAQGILWLLEELKVPYELKTYQRLKTMQAPPELEKIHPLGKSPVITIDVPGRPEPLVLAESAVIAQYMCDHWGGEDKKLVPHRWQEGKEGRVGGETEEFLRYSYHMSALEGSFFPYIWLGLILDVTLKSSHVPWLVRPITTAAANKIGEVLVQPNVARNYQMLEDQLKASPGGGKYLCGEHLTCVDILYAFPLLANKDTLNKLPNWAKGTPEKTYPRLHEYIAQLDAEPGWKRAADRIREITGTYELVRKP